MRPDFTQSGTCSCIKHKIFITANIFLSATKTDQRLERNHNENSIIKYFEREKNEYYLDRDLDLCLRLAFLPDLWDFSVDLERLRLDFLYFFSLLTSGEGDLLESESECLLLALAKPFLLALLSCRECLSVWESVPNSLSFLFFDLPFSSLTTELPFSFSLVFGFSFFLSTSFSLSLSFFFLSFSWLRLLSLLLSLSLLEAFCLCLLLRLWLLSLRSRLLFLSLSLSLSLLRLRLPLALSLALSLDLDLLLRLLRSLESLRSFLWRPDRSALLLLLSLPFSLRSLRCLCELWLRLRCRVLWDEERLRLLFLRGEEDREELREDAEEEDEEEEDRLLLWLEVERELLLWPLAGESLPPLPERSFPLPECFPSLPSLSLRDLRLSAKGSASLSFMSCLCGYSDWLSSYSPLSLLNLSFAISSVQTENKDSG